MTDVSPPTPDQRWFRCKNIDSVELEAYGLVKVRGTETLRSRIVIQVSRSNQYDGLNQLLAALGPTSIGVGKNGWCTCDWPAWVRYDTSETPAAGQIWGPDGYATRIRKGKVGFQTLGSGVGSPDRVLVDHQPHYHKAGWIRFQLPSGGMMTTDEYADGCNVLDWWDGFDPGSTVRVYNFRIDYFYLFEGQADAIGLAFYDPLTDRYFAVQMECPV